MYEAKRLRLERIKAGEQGDVQRREPTGEEILLKTRISRLSEIEESRMRDNSYTLEDHYKTIEDDLKKAVKREVDFAEEAYRNFFKPNGGAKKPTKEEILEHWNATHLEVKPIIRPRDRHFKDNSSEWDELWWWLFLISNCIAIPLIACVLILYYK